MKMYKVVRRYSYGSNELVGVAFSLDSAKSIPGAHDWQEVDGVIEGHPAVGYGHFVITEIETLDEPDFATLVGEAFYATAE